MPSRYHLQAVMQPHKLAQLIDLHSDELATLTKSTWKLNALNAIRRCRTGALGGHVAYCHNCKKTHHHKHSCRNRHCPNCQGHKQAKWQHDRSLELLQVPYFHVVFTVPAALNTVALQQPALFYKAMFDAAWEVVFAFAKAKLNAQMGMIAVLHTWGQNLALHPHLHCIVPGGGMTKAGYWRGTGQDMLFAVKAMSQSFKGRLLRILRERGVALGYQLGSQLYNTKWVVYAQPPCGNADQIVEYLARYTYKTAISNSRILSIDNENKKVCFRYKDYRHGGVQKVMTMDTREFLRRFCLHILPKGFTRIRHYGILSSTWKKEKLPHLQIKLADKSLEKPVEKKPFKAKINTCVYCGSNNIVLLITYTTRGPPGDMEKQIDCKLLKYNAL